MSDTNVQPSEIGGKDKDEEKRATKEEVIETKEEKEGEEKKEGEKDEQERKEHEEKEKEEEKDAAAEGEEKEEVPSEAAPAQCEFENISEEFLTELLSMGFGQIRALKALHFTKSASIEAALGWLEEHEDDADIDQPLTTAAAEDRPKLSKEEAQEKAYQLQKKLREERMEREKKEELERERNRIKATKLMQEQQKKLEEEERKRNLLHLKREKLEHQKEKEYQRQLLKREWEERFGKPYPEEEEAEQEKNIKTKSSKDQIIYYCGKLRKSYKDTNREGLKTCLSTLKVYFKNAHENPTNPKYLSIRKENNAFKNRVSCFDGAVDLLCVTGFTDDGESYTIHGCPDGYLLGTALKYIDVILNQL